MLLLLLRTAKARSERAFKVMLRECQTSSSCSGSNFSCSKQEPLSLASSCISPVLIECLWNFSPDSLWCFLRVCKWTRTFAFLRRQINNLQTDNDDNARNSLSTYKHKRLTIVHAWQSVTQLLMQVYISWQPVDSYQLEVINAKKSFSFITFLWINLFS